MPDKGQFRSPEGISLALASMLAELAEAAGIGLRLFRGWRPSGMEPVPESHVDQSQCEGMPYDPAHHDRSGR